MLSLVMCLCSSRGGHEPPIATVEPQRVFVVAQPNELDDVLKELPPTDPGKADKLFSNLGFTREAVGKDIYYFSVTIWPKKFFEETLKGFKALPDAIDGLGLIDQGKSPALRQLCVDIFDQSLGVTTSPTSKPGIRTNNWMQLSDGKRTVTIQVDPPNKVDESKRTSAMRASGGRVKSPKEMPSFRELPGSVPKLSNIIEVKLFSQFPDRVITRAQMTAKAFGLVAEGFADYQDNLNKIWPQLFQKLTDLGLADKLNGLEKGTFASQPKDVRDRMSEFLTQSASGYGFSDADSARDFLSRASVVGFGKSLTFTTWVSGDGNGDGYARGARLHVPYIGP